MGLTRELEAFLERYPVDDRARAYLLDSAAEVQAKVVQDFRAKREGESDYSAIIITFTKRCRGTSQATQHDPLDMFLRKYPVDEEAYNYLTSSPPEVLNEVIDGFKPKREGESDYSAIVITFTKRCRGKGKGSSKGSSGYSVPTQAPGHYNAPLPLGRSQYNDPRQFYAPGPSPRGYAAAAPPTYAVQEYAGSSLLEDLESFFQRFPVDERCYNYVIESPPDVQEQLLQGFKPKREGDSDYSAIVISFTKKCRERSQGGAGRAMSHQAPVAVQYMPGPGGNYGFTAPPHAVPQAFGVDRALEEFRWRFPMDDRAFAYLAETPLPARKRVIETFRPPRLDDTNYSAPVIAYAKQCRARVQQPLDPLEEFTQRYPVDDRAFAYLSESSPDVQARVLDEFKPKREGESDYSGAVVSYVKRCRNDGSGRSGDPSAKRARTY